MTRTLALTILALALLGLPSVALAQGPPAEKAPAHAGDQGPPDHAGDQGPPDHAEASGDGADDDAETSQGDEDRDPADEAAPPEHAGDQGPPDHAGDEGPPDHAEASGDVAAGSDAKAPEPRPTTPGSSDGEDATETAPTGEPAPVEADVAEEPDAPSTDEDAPIKEDASTDDETTETVDEESAGETTIETTETVTTLAASATSASVDDADEAASSKTSASTADPASQDPDLEAEDDELDEPAEADVADEPDATDPGPGTVDVEASLVQDRGAWNPSASPTLPAPGTDVSTEGGPGAAWSGSMPGASIGWILPSLAIGAVGAFALVRARTRPVEPAGPVKGTTSSPEPSPDAEAEAEPSTAQLPEPGLEGVLLLGQRALDQGDLEAAVGWFETAIAISPKEQAAHFCMGLCLDELGRLEEAADALDNAIELAPRDPLARYAQAGALAQLGRTGDALEHARRLARDSPGFREAMAEDEAFERLRDHPRFLALIGEL